ncbi:hypothetical protein BU24DRAFT_408826 [Aaosphaeria arxii CBS 175.79]|uniref:Uncharacterized protein n=1 Tax=Aaosphaeria arxii CBS 175.79 TaxID=1450172 RepID=A0A6A5XS38_9PLEO|nr:uncharacterized protein BU24DRAFT_408826 [Aaosphaeria arxii CBS 175.79]KAF2015627.1 hypothetical protein BU24DRAFT_408826 [Aaosphaeria arxii CBS 175.79]
MSDNTRLPCSDIVPPREQVSTVLESPQPQSLASREMSSGCSSFDCEAIGGASEIRMARMVLSVRSEVSFTPRRRDTISLDSVSSDPETCSGRPLFALAVSALIKIVSNDAQEQRANPGRKWIMVGRAITDSYWDHREEVQIGGREPADRLWTTHLRAHRRRYEMRKRDNMPICQVCGFATMAECHDTAACQHSVARQIAVAVLEFSSAPMGLEHR